MNNSWWSYSTDDVSSDLQHRRFNLCGIHSGFSEESLYSDPRTVADAETEDRRDNGRKSVLNWNGKVFPLININ